MPIVDISRYLDGSDPMGVVLELRHAATRVGFFQVVGHGVPHELIDSTRQVARHFFARPQDQKSVSGCLSLGEASNWRGYEHFASDNKEAFEIGLKTQGRVDAAGRPLPLHGDNLWPPGDPDFRHTVTAYHTATTNFARQLLGAMAWALGLDPRYFEAKVIEPLAHLRLWKYPPHTELAPHKDHGFLTVLLQDECYGGLQVLRRVQPKAVPVQKQSVVEDRSALNGDLESREIAEEIALASTLSQNQSESIWLDVPVIPHAFVINVGRLFEIFCRETFPATIHRVRYTPYKTAKPETSQPRISLALFFAPDWDVTVVPPSALRAPGVGQVRSVQSGPHILFGYRWQQYVNSGEIPDVAAAKRRALEDISVLANHDP